ncbi:MAG: thiamine pyrophosphate-dependent enzyme [Acidobacteria bacterium]|nr:thiamine pyrophosphate-dependent enzyme [Acidobacteriota bacterium]
MKRFDVIEHIIKMADPSRDALVFANGRISREACYLQDGDNHFYMLASMGQAPMIGLGLAMTHPERRIIVIDGDGNLLMSLGALANVVGANPRNFLHIVLDNQVYGTTGSQQSLSRVVDLSAVAKASGYRNVVREQDDLAAAKKSLSTLLLREGPNFLLVQVDQDDLQGTPPPQVEASVIRDRFRAWMASDVKQERA